MVAAAAAVAAAATAAGGPENSQPCEQCAGLTALQGCDSTVLDGQAHLGGSKMPGLHRVLVRLPPHRPRLKAEKGSYSTRATSHTWHHTAGSFALAPCNNPNTSSPALYCRTSQGRTTGGWHAQPATNYAAASPFIPPPPPPPLAPPPQPLQPPPAALGHRGGLDCETTLL